MCHKIVLVGLVLFTLLSGLVSSTTKATKGNVMIIYNVIRMKTMKYLFLILLIIEIIVDSMYIQECVLYMITHRTKDVVAPLRALELLEETKSPPIQFLGKLGFSVASQPCQ